MQTPNSLNRAVDDGYIALPDPSLDVPARLDGFVVRYDPRERRETVEWEVSALMTRPTRDAEV